MTSAISAKVNSGKTHSHLLIDRAPIDLLKAVGDDPKRGNVVGSVSPECKAHIDMIKRGPAVIPEVLQNHGVNNPWVD